MTMFSAPDRALELPSLDHPQEVSRDQLGIAHGQHEHESLDITYCPPITNFEC